jgi:hypothetical protein
MENLQNNISKIYSLGVILSAISCLARADFNMPLFVFAYFMWKKEVAPYIGREDTSHSIAHGNAIHGLHMAAVLGAILGL